MIRRALATLLLPLVLPSAGVADVLLQNRFEDGDAGPWHAVGSASVAVTRYAGNASLHLAAGSVALARLSTRGHTDVTVTLAFAGRALGHGGRCAADVSADQGRHWTIVHELRAGADDGVTLRPGGRRLEELADRDDILIRLRALSHAEAAECWADDIEVSARPVSPPPPAADAIPVPPVAGTTPGPWPMQAFRMPGDAMPPLRRLEGRLVLGTTHAGSFNVLEDRYHLALEDHGDAAIPPAATLEVVTDGTELLPLRRGTIVGAHPAWDWVFEPGHAWRDAGDPTVTHVVMPFALEERNANCMHSGMLSIAIAADGRSSDAALQIAGETCAYFQFDQWALLGTTFERATLPTAEAVVAARRRERAARLPVRPIGQLAVDHPGVDPDQFGSPREVSPRAMTAYGLVVDGIHYVGACPTRSGIYPDCDEMPLPSYSLAKSLVAGLALMSLERLYPGSAALAVADLVPECDPRDWRGVTLLQLLDMSSGHYGSAADQADEDGADLLPFFVAEDHASRLAFACGHYPRKEAPGQRWVYHTSDTYLLGTAIARAYRRRVGDAADFYRDLLVRGLFAPLDLNPALADTRRTRDSAAQPFTGYGLTLHRDDIARLGVFLMRVADEPAADAPLDRVLLREALQRDPQRRGLVASGPEVRYQHGFWAWNASRALGCRGEAWVPFLSGFGGIVVALFPNGVVYYYVSDGGEFRWALAAREANRLRPFCEASP